MEIIAEMMRHTIENTPDAVNNEEEECPYPWIFSDLMTVEAVQTILQVYPQGVLQRSSLLSNLSPLDFFLRSTGVIETRVFDQVMWSKFKLVLVAAQCTEEPECNQNISPVHTILKRYLSYSDFFENMHVARHALWLLHQLFVTDQWVFEKFNARGQYPLQFVLGQKLSTAQQPGLVVARELIKILLQAHPQSAKYKQDGRFAIHMAVENGWPCHDLLLALFPEALEVPDAKNMLPFQTAAASSSAGCRTETSGMISGLDIAFELLRANPTQILSIRNYKINNVSAHA